MKISREKILSFTIYLYVVIFAFLSLFTFNDDHINSAVNMKNMVIPYYNLNITIALCVLSIVSIFVVSVINKKKYIDIVFLLLLFRACIYLIPIIYIRGDFNIGTVFAAFQCTLVYYICLNSKTKTKVIINILTIFSLLIAFEVFYTLLYNHLSILSNKIKWFMVIPLGKSNYIACYLVPLYVVVSRYYENNKIFYCLYTIIMFLGILGTASKLALILISTYIIYQINKNMIFKKKILSKNLLSFLLKVTALTLAMVFFVKYNSSGFNNILDRFTSNNIFESRLYVYSEAIDLFLKNPILGRSAFVFKVYDSYKAHNFLIESLVETGIFGTILFLSALILIYKKINKIKNYRLKYLILGFITIYLIQGLIEPNLFIVNSDTFFWLTITSLIVSENEGVEKEKELFETL